MEIPSSLNPHTVKLKHSRYSTLYWQCTCNLGFLTTHKDDLKSVIWYSSRLEFFFLSFFLFFFF